ncbi:MAG: pectin acetylesterase-family hydrolase [Pseudomonadota bacterium]
MTMHGKSPSLRYAGAVAIAASLLTSGCTAPPETATLGSESAKAWSSGRWTRIPGGGETLCSDGSPYAFFVRPGDPEKLVFYLQGGGACWNLQTCDPLGTPSYTINVDRANPEAYDGIFNFDRADNPLREHTFVFAPYCSADVHLGDAEQRYERSEAWIDRLLANNAALDRDTIEPTFTIQHRGFANVQAVLDWTTENVRAPSSILVTGSSAGAIPSPYYASKLAAHYPDASINQLGDGAGGYRRSNDTTNPNLAWNTVQRLASEPEFRDLSEAEFNYEALYLGAHRAQPRIRLHAYDTAEDDVQLRFLALGGGEVPSLLTTITANQNDIRSAVPGFRSFIAGGELHTVLARPEFYRYRVGPRTVRDWVEELAAGRAVADRRCSPCASAEELP